jgi:hypothetical protein
MIGREDQKSSSRLGQNPITRYYWTLKGPAEGKREFFHRGLGILHLILLAIQDKRQEHTLNINRIY